MTPAHQNTLYYQPVYHLMPLITWEKRRIAWETFDGELSPSNDGGTTKKPPEMPQRHFYSDIKDQQRIA